MIQNPKLLCMKKYYLFNGTVQEGPFDIEDLRSKNVNGETPVWYEGLSTWKKIGDVEELKTILAPIPPPFPISRATSPTVNTQQTFSDAYPKPSTWTGRKLLIISGIVVLALIAVFIFTQLKQQAHQTERQNIINDESDTKETIRNNITSYVTAQTNEYTYNNLGGISNLEITVNNSTNYLLDVVKVKVIYIKKNGDIWDSKVVDWNLIEPNRSMTRKFSDTERGTSVKCEIVSIKSTSLGLN